MIQQQTLLNVADNSGAKTVRCIKVLGGFKRKHAFLGNVIVVAVSKLRNKTKKNSKVKKGEVLKALIVKTKRKHCNKDGSVFWFDNSSVSLFTKQEKPLASRVIGPLPAKLKKGRFAKIVSISSGTII